MQLDNYSKKQQKRKINISVWFVCIIQGNFLIFKKIMMFYTGKIRYQYLNFLLFEFKFDSNSQLLFILVINRLLFTSDSYIVSM